MKRMVLGVAAVLMLTAGAVGAAHAAEGPEVEAGGKIWFNTLKSANTGFSETSSMAVLIGPAVEVTFPNNVFIDGSIMTTATKYKFDAPFNTELSRTDIDVAVGYACEHKGGVYAGYRNSEVTAGGSKTTTSGPLVGVRGSVPVTGELSIYGDLAYLIFTDKPDTGSSESAPGIGVEVGVKYAFAKNLDGAVGYKMEQTKGADTKNEATFTGFALDVMHKF